jgi:putative pyruvate formate lyase activating enzyme
LAASGELQERADALREKLRACRLCPRNCGIDRTAGQLGFCKAGARAVVSSFNAHHGEEPPISGERGSGTVFLAHCTMRCKFCQNFPISQQGHGKEMNADQLADCYLKLQRRGVHNLNFVTPTHYSAAIVEALVGAVGKGFRLPIVYNTSGYESVEVLRLLEGIVDIYLPDAKYVDPEKARAYSDAPDYVERNLPALREMRRQVGDLELDEWGIARRGLIIRHLVLPGAPDDSISVLRMIKEQVSPTAFVALMSQYFPANAAHGIEPLNRRVSPEEYEKVVEYMEESGLDGFIQPMS